MEQRLITADHQEKGVAEINRNLLGIEQQEEAEIDLIELFFVLLSHWRSLLMCFLIGAVLMGAFHTRMVKSAYQASTELYVTSTDSVISLQDLQLGSALTADYQSIIKSRGVLNKVISDLALDVDYKALGKMITVSNPSGTHIIHTNVKTNDLALSRDIANDLLLVSIDRIFQIVGTSEPTIIDYSEAEAVEDVTPSLTKYMALGGIMGFILAAAVFIIQVMMDRTLKTEEDVEKYLQLPVLSAVPYYND